MEYPKFKVCCRCFTFNQAKYITDTMNGFTMQQTDFPFVCAIVDDASTDGEQEVIRKYVEEYFDLSDGSESYKKETDYAHIIYAQHKTNENCYFAVLFLKENHYSSRKPKMQYLSEWRDMCDYEALCEGDDYWIKRNKLQNQFELLEKNSDVSLVYSNFVCVDKNGNEIFRPKYESFKNKSGDGFRFLPLLKFGNHIMTLTVMVRLNVFKSYYYTNCTYKFDYSLFMSASVTGKLQYCNDKTSCYRNNPNSMVNTISNKIEKMLRTTQYDFIKFYLDGKINKRMINKPFATRLLCIRLLSGYPKEAFLPLIMRHPQYFLLFTFIYILRLVKNIYKHSINLFFNI